MGGGDLNLKKSWHPSTMKNMEKVWKAEQQDTQEKKRIAELKKEIAMERDREELKAYAMAQGVIEKKEDKKLEWMYKGPNDELNREDYLLGRKIDKQFEKMVQAEKEVEQNKTPIVKNHVEHECIPPSLRFFSGDEQVDLARKLQEDPLYAIKKKEVETRAQLLKNPVKLKQIQQLVALASSSKEEKMKKQKKKRKHSSDSEDDLDALLAEKYKKLKGAITEKDLLKSVKKHKKSKKSKKHKKKAKDSSSDSDDSSDDDSRRSHEKHSTRNYGLMKADGTKIHLSKKESSSLESKKALHLTKKEEKKWEPPKRNKLTEEEKEQRRREMLNNAVWRDKEREKNLKRHEEQEKKFQKEKKSFDKTFAQKHLALAADKETVASRIKSNVNNIQRHKHSMDSNFARR